MITCEFCGTQAEQHDHWRHEIMARVAALEDVVTREPEPPADAEQYSPKEEPNPATPDRYETDGTPAGEAARLRGTSASGVAGEGLVPPGWKLAPGWRVDSDAPDSDTCMHIDADGAFDCLTHVLFGRADDENAGACAAHAVEMGALVKDEPPAEQPSRQETGGGETAWECPGCACCNDDACPLKHADCEHKQPAEPSETGQLPSAPVCQCGHSRDYHVNGFHEARDCGFAMDRGGFCACARYREQAAANPAPIAGPTAPAAGTLSEEAALMGHQQAALLRRIDELHAKLAQAERERDERGRQVEQMAAHVATMRVELDEASRVREDKALRERDEMAASREWWMERYNGAVKEREEATATIERVAYNTPEAVARSESDVTVLIELRRAQKERDEATARERERCLAWAQADIDNGKIAEAISSGAPAPKCDPDPPREVAPDRAQAEDCARCPVCRWPLAETVDKGCVPGNCSYRPRERGNP